MFSLHYWIIGLLHYYIIGLALKNIREEQKTSARFISFKGVIPIKNSFYDKS